MEGWSWNGGVAVVAALRHTSRKSQPVAAVAVAAARRGAAGGGACALSTLALAHELS